MKNVALILFLLFFYTEITQAQCTRDAVFQDGPDYTLNGSATLTYLLDGTKNLSFDNEFATPSGPDLHVYLSQSAIVSTPGGVLETPNTIDLGLLKSPSGSQSYDLTGINPSIDLDSYDYVIIHCKEYNHYWGTGSFGTQSGGDCNSLSVSTINTTTVAVYPTFVKNNKFTIELKNQQKPILNIYSIIGEIVQKPLILTKEINSIETAGLKSGIYILHLNFGESIRTQKIIIE